MQNPTMVVFATYEVKVAAVSAAMGSVDPEDYPWAWIHERGTPACFNAIPLGPVPTTRLEEKP